ncbi:hypothetical protein H0H92_001724, partial [Tricholoma furcatifolium]
MKPFLQLSLPKFSGDHTILHITCCGEPNPLPHGSPHSSQPFHPISADAVIIFAISAYCESQDIEEMYSLIVHRRSLLELCLGRERKPDYRPEINSNGVAEVVSWEEWGPQRTRWFMNHDRITKWNDTAMGQRVVFLGTPDEDRAGDHDDDRAALAQRITVLDFNPNRVRELAKRGAGPDVMNRNHVQDPVHASLPYVSVEKLETFSDSCPLARILMDEERLVGVK